MNSLEINALLYGIEALWQRAGLTLDRTTLFLTPELTEGEKQRFSLARRLLGGKGEPDKNPFALQSIFGSISLGLEGKTGYVPVKPLRVDDAGLSIYPTASEPSGLQAAYRDLCLDLTKKAENLLQAAGSHPEAYLEGLYLLLAQVTSNVPVSKTLPDVSLFDYTHMLAAVCSCLLDLDEAEFSRLYNAKDDLLKQSTAIAALVGGDISGIQDFIYRVENVDNAAKNLRGRSFYLQILTDAALRYVLRRLELPITSVIYSGGAHFFLLAPAHRVESLLADIKRELTEIVLNYHGRDLYLALGSAGVKVADFADGAISGVWSALHSNLRQSKLRRYAELPADILYDRIFTPGSQAAPTDNQEFIEWGTQLARASHVLYGIQQGAVPDHNSDNAPAALGLTFAFDTRASGATALNSSSYIVRLAFNDAAPVSPLRLAPGQTVVEGTRYTMTSMTDLTFDELAGLPVFKQEGQSHGISRLGVLRMDVDNLGKIFAQGLGQRATLTRVAGLSRTMAVFFEGRVPAICHHIKAEGRADETPIYAVYAGGDDVFIVGPWHLMPPLAAHIREEFDHLTLAHPDLHISGGIALVGKKYPLYSAAERAAEALERAKSREGKDALGFLEEVIGWKDEFVEVNHWAQEFIKRGRDNEFPMSLLGRLTELELMRREVFRQRREAGVKNAETNAGRWVWVGIYQLHRLAEQYAKKAPQTTTFIKDVLVALQQNHFAKLPLLALAARWAHYSIRRTQDEG